VSQEESEHNEVDGMKKGVDSTGEVMHTDLSSFVNRCCLPNPRNYEKIRTYRLFEPRGHNGHRP